MLDLLIVLESSARRLRYDHVESQAWVAGDQTSLVEGRASNRVNWLGAARNPSRHYAEGSHACSYCCHPRFVARFMTAVVDRCLTVVWPKIVLSPLILMNFFVMVYDRRHVYIGKTDEDGCMYSAHR